MGNSTQITWGIWPHMASTNHEVCLSMCAIGSKLLILKMVITPWIVNSYNGHLNPYKVHDYPYHRKTMGVEWSWRLWTEALSYCRMQNPKNFVNVVPKSSRGRSSQLPTQIRKARNLPWKHVFFWGGGAFWLGVFPVWGCWRSLILPYVFVFDLSSVRNLPQKLLREVACVRGSTASSLT